LVRALPALGRLLLESGERDEAERTFNELSQAAQLRRDARADVSVQAAGLTMLFLDGHLEQAIAVSDTYRAAIGELAQGRNLWLGGFPILFAASVRARLYLGQEVEALFAEYPAQARPILAARMMMLSYLGRCDEALEIRARFGDVGADDDE